MKKWIKMEETGQLYLEKILVTFDIPILFICSNDKFPYGKPQTDEVARGSGTESMAVRD